MENLSAIAVNKFLFYSQNWGTVAIRYQSISGEEEIENVPDFFPHLHFPCGTEHMVEKWLYARKTYKALGGLIWFYFQLNNKNRIELIEYVMENYKYEQKLEFGDE